MTDVLTPKQLDEMFAATDDAALAREDRKLQAERRQALIVDYLFAAEEADAAPRNRARAKTLDSARRALAAHLVTAGEYPDVDTAAAAADARTVRSMPQPGVDYSKVVPF